MALLGDVVKWRLISACLEIVLASKQERCTVCAKFICSKISLVHLMVLLGDVGEVEARFSPFRDGVNLDVG